MTERNGILATRFPVPGKAGAWLLNSASQEPQLPFPWSLVMVKVATLSASRFGTTFFRTTRSVFISCSWETFYSKIWTYLSPDTLCWFAGWNEGRLGHCFFLRLRMQGISDCPLQKPTGQQIRHFNLIEVTKNHTICYLYMLRRGGQYILYWQRNAMEHDCMICYVIVCLPHLSNVL